MFLFIVFVETKKIKFLTPFQFLGANVNMKRWNPTNERSTRHIQTPTLHTENQMKELDEGVRYFDFVIIFFFLGLRMNGNNIFRSDLAFKCNSNVILCACVVVYDVIKKRGKWTLTTDKGGVREVNKEGLYKKLETIRSGWGHRSPSPIYNWFFFFSSKFIYINLRLATMIDFTSSERNGSLYSRFLSTQEYTLNSN